MMTNSADTDELFEDYVRLVAALLPDVTGLACHDRTGHPVWSGGARPDANWSAADPSGVRAFLAESPARGRAWLAGRGGATLLLRLADERERVLGALSIGTEGSEAASARDCRAVLAPALRTLARELSLRMRPVDAQKKLEVQAAEETQLHEVETLLHERRDCVQVLQRLLDLAVSRLDADRAALAVPDKELCLTAGDAEWSVVETMLARARDDPPAADRAEDAGPVLMRIESIGPAGPGWLLLDGWSRSRFSPARRRRVARYLRSHVMTVLARDFDPLTGLMSWPGFERRLRALAADTEAPVQVLYGNVDRLHLINDNFGRSAGDELLARLATRLKEDFPGMPVTRVAGDAFAVVLPDAGNDYLLDRARALCRRFAEIEYSAEGRSLRASVSLGIAPLADVANGEGLALAQLACQAAKERGRGRVEVSAAADQSIVQRFDDIQVVGRVRAAIQQDRLLLLAQPIARLRGGGGPPYFEVLVRMTGDDGQALSPAAFLSAAERYQLMEELDRWVLSRSLDFLAARRATAGPLRLAVNLSGQSLGSEQFLPYVLERLQASGVPPEWLCFEITESVAVANIQRAQAFMRALHRLGCRFSLDDFGTGLSSFGYLKLFPVDTVKIDGSFVADLATNPVSQSVVAAIAEFARVQGLETVAEYVQDDRSVALLGDLGVVWGQGYLFGRPIPLDACLDHLPRSAGEPGQPGQPFRPRRTGDADQ